MLVAALAVPIGIAALRVRGRLVRDRLDRAGAHPAAGVPELGVVHRRLARAASCRGRSPDMLRPEHHRVFYYLFAALLGAGAAGLVADRPVPVRRWGSRRSARTRTRRRRWRTPTFAYKLVVFVVSAVFTALAGGLYALWFGDLDPVFQFSILTGAYMVLMALLGGVRNLFGPLVGALIVGSRWSTSRSSTATRSCTWSPPGCCSALVVLFMPDGILPAVGALLDRLRRGESSIREVTAEPSCARERERTSTAATASARTAKPMSTGLVRPTSS